MSKYIINTKSMKYCFAVNTFLRKSQRNYKFGTVVTFMSAEKRTLESYANTKFDEIWGDCGRVPHNATILSIQTIAVMLLNPINIPSWCPIMLYHFTHVDNVLSLGITPGCHVRFCLMPNTYLTLLLNTINWNRAKLLSFTIAYMDLSPLE